MTVELEHYWLLQPDGDIYPAWGFRKPWYPENILERHIEVSTKDSNYLSTGILGSNLFTSRALAEEYYRDNYLPNKIRILEKELEELRKRYNDGK